LEILAQNSYLNFKIRCSPNFKVGLRECLISISLKLILKSKQKRKKVQSQLKISKIPKKRLFKNKKNQSKLLKNRPSKRKSFQSKTELKLKIIQKQDRLLENN